MIKVQKGPAPSSLVRTGKTHAQELCAAFDAHPDLYRSGKRKMDVRKSIYASTAVKAALEVSHHGKCCYCETVIPKPYAHSYVDHWRPSRSSRQVRDKKQRIWPGYYWIAYSWDNLLLSCFPCNSTYKNDLFPLLNPGARARHHGMRIEDEIPAILKPDGDEDPRDHITFRGADPVGITPLGRKTIEVLKLDSPKHGFRLARLDAIRRAREMYTYLVGKDDPMALHFVEGLRTFVEEAVRPDMPYSAMVAVYLQANPLPQRAG